MTAGPKLGLRAITIAKRPERGEEPEQRRVHGGVHEVQGRRLEHDAVAEQDQRHAHEGGDQRGCAAAVAPIWKAKA